MAALLKCPFCGATPHQGPGKKYTCQMHGDECQNYDIWCPHRCAQKSGANKEVAIEAWNTRAQSASRIAGLEAQNAALKADVERLLRCMSMAMGCLDNFSDDKDERLAWYRLLDGTEGREPRSALSGGNDHG